MNTPLLHYLSDSVAFDYTISTISARDSPALGPWPVHPILQAIRPLVEKHKTSSTDAVLHWRSFFVEVRQHVPYLPACTVTSGGLVQRPAAKTSIF